MNRINASIWKFAPTPEGVFISDHVHDIIIDYIQNGTLKPGMQIPSYRLVGRRNKMPRTTISRIYRRLENEGWVVAYRGSGTYVAGNFPGHELLYPTTRAVEKLPVKFKRFRSETILKKRDLNDFTIIGLDTLSPYYLPPRLYSSRLVKHAVTYDDFNQLDSIEELEALDLKAAILTYLNSKRNFMINSACMEVIICREKSLRQVFNVLLEPNDVIVNTSPRDKMLLDLFEACDVTIHHICPAEGNFITELVGLLENISIRALYLRPQCSYPESYTLSAADCARLLELAKLHDFYIVEEDDYHECWYDHKPFVPLICQQHEGHVIYCGALSLLSSYLQQTRTIVAAAEFIALMRASDAVPTYFRDALAEQAIIEILNNGKLCENVKKMKREKEKHMFEAWLQLENSLSRVVQVARPLAGLSLWLVYPDADTLADAICCLENAGFKIPYFPGASRPGPGLKYIRFGIGTWDLNESSGPSKLLFEKFNADCKVI